MIDKKEKKTVFKQFSFVVKVNSENLELWEWLIKNKLINKTAFFIEAIEKEIKKQKGE